MGLLELLQAGDVDQFNDARGSHGRIELFAEELAELALKGIDLSGAVLDKSDLTGSDLTEANLVRASLAEIDGTGLILDGVLGMSARLRDAYLEDADLTGADFSNGDLSGATLTGTKGEGLRLLHAKLKDVVATDASWGLADLSEATLKGADFTGAFLEKAKLTDAKAGGATFTRANLSGIDAANLKLGGAKCDQATFAGARLTGAHFSGADLTNADFRGADLTKANLSGANLTGTDLRGAILIDAVLEGVDLSAARIDDADLTGVDVGSLGLDEDVLESLAGHGARYDPDAPLVFDDAAVAVRGSQVAALWLNPDGPDTPTLRWALHDGGDLKIGVLPVSGAAVLFHGIAAVPDGFRLVALIERPDGPSLQTWPLRDGQVDAPVGISLGYDPAVLPVLDVDDRGLVLTGLARRGPTIVVHRDRLDGRGFQPVSSDARPQARGFVGRTHPVLLCKGGVAMSVAPDGLGPPRRTPESFPSRICTAAPLGDHILALWAEAPKGRDPGGLRWIDLGPRASETEVLTRIGAVNGVDAIPDGDAVLVAWTEDEGDEGGRAQWARLPGGAPTTVPLPSDALDQIKIVRDAVDGSPVIAVSTLAGRLRVHRLDGAELACFEDTSP